MRHPERPAVILVLAATAFSCSIFKIDTTAINDSLEDQAPVIIYKTSADHYDHVPVIMDDAKEQIISYPAPSDLLKGDHLLLPVWLKKGFLLDRRGLHPNSVFTSYTYEEYAQLKSPPPLEELKSRIIDKDPFESMYRCGTRSDYSDLVTELNARIRKDLGGFTRIR